MGRAIRQCLGVNQSLVYLCEFGRGHRHLRMPERIHPRRFLRVRPNSQLTKVAKIVCGPRDPIIDCTIIDHVPGCVLGSLWTDRPAKQARVVLGRHKEKVSCSLD
jgi:hypothetical protein